MAEHDEDFELIVEFDTDDESFARGVEVGMLWQRLHAEPLPIDVVVHANNAEMALRLAEARGASVRADQLGADHNDWLSLTFC